MENPRILIIEDSAAQRRLMSEYLKKIDAKLEIVEDGTVGLERALAGGFDLILSDIELPGISGLEICRRVKNECNPSVAVILVSTLSADLDIERGFEAGAAAYLPKPFRGEDLLHIVEDAMHKTFVHQQQRILIVDDSSVIRTILARGLNESGFETVCAANGVEAFRLAREKKPDLVLTDLNMPEMNGMQLCRQLKHDSELHDLPLVVMSANGDKGTMRRMVSMGAAGFLVKPFSHDQAAILIEKLLDDHVQLIRKDKERSDLEREMMLASIMSLVQALEARDNYTGSHSRSVAEVAVVIARKMGLSEYEIEAIHIAGRLHDIGKIGIRDEVLLKPGKLTDDEFALIKKHPQIGYGILKPINSLADALPAVLHHHEKFGGGGYPHGLAGKEIPLNARIIAVADVWHAVYSNRPYRPAMPREKALSIIREESGLGLCPECVAAFFALEEAGMIPDTCESEVETTEYL